MKNLRMKALVAAATMAVAGQASAALSGDTQADGSLFLTVWDVVTNESYVRDLGVSIDGFVPGPALTSSAGATVGAGQFNFAGSSLFTSVFSDNTAANLRWTIVGVDSEEFPGNNSRFVSTVNNAYTGSPAILNAQVRGVSGNAVAFQSELIANGNPAFGDPGAIEFTSVGLGSTEGGGPNWGPNLGGGSTLNHAGDGFGTAQFWYAESNSALNAASPPTEATRFGNSPTNFATFSLGLDGAVTYALTASEVTAVPLPAAAWLMGAGLLGLGGAARRRKAAAKA